MAKKCFNKTCSFYGPNRVCSTAEKCQEYIPPTHADCIRAMSDEELAAFLTMVAKRHCFAEGDFPYHPCNQERDCKKCALDWLQKAAEEE